ncbi:PPOX class F420-dependent oxidoreductase [Kutzneria chonburiensis]|uniref:PPOX class F420-dependent oxidoreductase n=1 Tax=Kutzneria chonburiensis TaxID=1483604 RepID=A0ABV6MKR9_9PSEU|nr:PPOX class F420-dependent oxidoreductase [Kutzneria chonburiensis]
MTALPEEVHDLLDSPQFASLATIEPTGQPHLSVVWFKREGDDILVSTVRGRRKAVNIDRDARATLLVHDSANPYRYVEIRGAVTVVDDPPGSLINELSLRYKGVPWTTDKPGTERVIVRLSPAKVVVH